MSTPEDPYRSRPADPPVWDAPPAWGPPPQAGGHAGGPGGYAGPQQTEAKALVALVLAIAAYTPVVPFIGAIAALVLSRMARRDIEASAGRKSGLGLCTAATVLSIVHLVLIGLLFLLIAAVFLLPFSFGP